MNIHKNARLTPQGRLLLVRRVDKLDWRMPAAATAAGITPDCAAFQDPETAPWLEKYYTINENWRSEDRRRRLAFARDPLNSDYAGHRLTFRLFAQSPPFAHLTAVYRKFRLGRTAPLRPQVRWPFGPGARRHRSAAVAHNRRVA